MQYDFSKFKRELQANEDWLKKELSSIRTGRATPSILDAVLVESYGAKVPVNQVASINLEDARSLRITPYDVAHVKNVEKAIVQSNLGLSVAVDEKGIRVIFPELTAERRGTFVKIAKDKLEETRRKLRSSRDEVWKDIQNKEREGSIREDDKFRLKTEMEKIAQESSKRCDDLLAKKEKEINS